MSVSVYHEDNLSNSPSALNVGLLNYEQRPWIMSDNEMFGEECFDREAWSRANKELREGEYDFESTGYDWDITRMESLLDSDLKNEEAFEHYLEIRFNQWVAEGPAEDTITALVAWICQVKLALTYTRSEHYDCNGPKRPLFLKSIRTAVNSYIENLYDNDNNLSDEGKRVRELLKDCGVVSTAP